MSAASLDRDRLVRVLGMLGSAHDGEVLAAARQAERLRSEARLTWADVIVPVLAGPIRERDVDTIEDALDYALEFEDELTEWERNFVATLRRQRTRASDKQVSILDQILVKVRRAEARAA